MKIIGRALAVVVTSLLSLSVFAHSNTKMHYGASAKKSSAVIKTLTYGEALTIENNTPWYFDVYTQENGQEMEYMLIYPAYDYRHVISIDYPQWPVYVEVDIAGTHDAIFSDLIYPHNPNVIIYPLTNSINGRKSTVAAAHVVAH